MLLEVHPQVGVGPLRFGMSEREVREQVAEPASPFMKATWSKHTTDVFNANGMHVYCSKAGVCEAVELFSPTEPTLNGSRLLGVSYRAAAAAIRLAGGAFTEDGSGLESTGVGVALYAPAHGEDPLMPVESVFVFAPGYYDR
jgi:hypothetical protein